MAISSNSLIGGQTYFVLVKSGREILFADNACYRYYTVRLLNCLHAYNVTLHAYILMPNEVQLLLTPGIPKGVNELLEVVNQAYTEYLKARFGASENCLEFKSEFSLVQEGSLLFDCQKYLELAPVRSQLVEHPGEYEWSSYCVNAFGGHGKLLAPHRPYRKMAMQLPNHFAVYRRFLARPFNRNYYAELDSKLRNGFPLVEKYYIKNQVRAIKRRCQVV
jgi:putative transposase